MKQSAGRPSNGMRALLAVSLITVGCRSSSSPATCTTCEVSASASASASASIDLELDAEFFDVPLDGGDVVFVIDGSGSMRDDAPSFEPPAGIGAAPQPGVDVDVSEWFPSSKFGRAQKELILAVRALPDDARVGVIYFGDGIASFAPVLIALDDSARADLEDFVLAQLPFGGATLADGLRAAYPLGAPQLVILSDGLVRDAAGPRRLLLDARDQMARGVRFDTVAAGPAAHDDLLVTLADESGGVATALP